MHFVIVADELGNFTLLTQLPFNFSYVLEICYSLENFYFAVSFVYDVFSQFICYCFVSVFIIFTFN